ncbi:DUF3316 domain-containing protein [Vibrio algarum]|uniref:DUF3316 domain-containing protein n=1 Tax=Vibrio algarum TaxID=3020714 RepID=A0ABT4YVA6_9VIBR|nr:DUF3316 domain-containing protein [Vibrio sp. KJ40-1]MDB1124949.1 DUF3316 domain-containing protein [Vibrio sp. KJ40-1]
MTKLIAVTAGLLVASSAFASVHTTYNETSVTTSTYLTKAEAYDAGFDIAESLQSMTQSQLRSELPSFTQSRVRNIALEGTEVKVEEIAANRGDIQYRAVVDIDYRFDAKERN